MRAEAMMELPKYKCHKEVWALKIKKIDFEPRSAKDDVSCAVITPEDTQYLPIRLGKDYVRKHNPEVGGYWVRYADGYTSYSPQKPFEEGYTLVAGA